MSNPLIEKVKRIHKEERRIQTVVCNSLSGIGDLAKSDKKLLMKLRKDMLDLDSTLFVLYDSVGYEPTQEEIYSNPINKKFTSAENLFIGIQNLWDILLGEPLPLESVPDRFEIAFKVAQDKFKKAMEAYFDVIESAEKNKANDREAREGELKKYEDELQMESKLLILKTGYMLIGLMSTCTLSSPWTEESNKKGIRSEDERAFRGIISKGYSRVIDEISTREWGEMKECWRIKDELPLSYFVSRLIVLGKECKATILKYEDIEREGKISKKGISELETLRGLYDLLKELKEKAIEIEERAKDDLDIVANRLYRRRVRGF
jgi:hypothetical protein